MIGKIRTRWGIGGLGGLAAAALVSCGMDPHVIESDDTTQAVGPAPSFRTVSVRAFSADGAVASGARVELWPLDSLADAPALRETTDSRGEAALRVGPGRWSVVVRREGSSFRREIGSGDSLRDTLRPMGALVGILPCLGGQIVSMPAAGIRSTCGATGFFRMDSLPIGAGSVSLVLPSGRRAKVAVGSGRPTLVLGSSNASDSLLAGLPTDSLVAWSDQSPPLRLHRRSLGYSGDFALAVRFRRVDSISPIQVLSWTNGASEGLKVAWRGRDTLFLTVDGRTLVGLGVPLDTGSRQLGVSWEGGTLRLFLDADEVVSMSYATAQARGEWSTPVIGAQGMGRLEWVALQRDSLTQGWLERLSRM